MTMLWNRWQYCEIDVPPHRPISVTRLVDDHVVISIANKKYSKYHNNCSKPWTCHRKCLWQKRPLSPVALLTHRKCCKYHTEFAKNSQNAAAVYARQANYMDYFQRTLTLLKNNDRVTWWCHMNADRRVPISIPITKSITPPHVICFIGNMLYMSIYMYMLLYYIYTS